MICNVYPPKFNAFQFREMRENCVLLKEKLDSKEEKLKRAEARLVDLAKLETQNEVSEILNRPFHNSWQRKEGCVCPSILCET